MILKCRICRQPIGRFEPGDVSWPIDPAAFESYDPKHGWPKPFLAGVDWDNALCPYCRKKPYYWTEPWILLTDQGEYDVKQAPTLKSERPSEVLSCRFCGEGPFRNYQQRVAHERTCDARAEADK